MSNESDDVGLFRSTAEFIRCVCLPICDIGERNSKSEYLSDHFQKDIDQITSYDLNWELHSGQLYETVFCFEVLEHLQNQLLFVKKLSELMTDDGVLYLSTPSRPKFLWTPHHFHEVDRKRLQHWLLDPFDLDIVRYKRLRVHRKWWFYFTGFRPFLRFFFDWTWIYEVRKLT